MDVVEIGGFAKLSYDGTARKFKPVLVDGHSVLVGEDDNGEEFFYLMVKDKEKFEQFIHILSMVD